MVEFNNNLRVIPTASILYEQTPSQITQLITFCHPLSSKSVETKMNRNLIFLLFCSKGKGKAVPLQAWSGPESSRKLRFPDYMTTAHDGGKVVSLTHRPSLPPGNAPVTHFC